MLVATDLLSRGIDVEGREGGREGGRGGGKEGGRDGGFEATDGMRLVRGSRRITKNR